MSLINGKLLQALTGFGKAKAATTDSFIQLPTGEMGVSELMPKYSALTKAQQGFSARSPLATLSLAGTAMTGLVLLNPANSGVDLHVTLTSGNVVVTSATTTGIALAYGTQGLVLPTGTTALTPLSNYVGGGQVPAAKVYSAATLAAAPVAALDLLHNAAAIATTGEDQGFIFDLGGTVVVSAGSYVTFIALGAASAASAVNLGINWLEIVA